MKPELKDPINAAGVTAACIGGLGMFGIFFGAPDALALAAFILWAIGTGILIYHSRHGEK